MNEINQDEVKQNEVKQNEADKTKVRKKISFAQTINSKIDAIIVVLVGTLLCAGYMIWNFPSPCNYYEEEAPAANYTSSQNQITNGQDVTAENVHCEDHTGIAIIMCQLIYGQENDRQKAWQQLNECFSARNYNKKHFPFAIKRTYFHNLYTELHPTKKTTPDNLEMHEGTYWTRWTGTSDAKFFHGMHFLDTYVRLNYPRSTADVILAKFDKIVKESGLDASKYDDKDTNGPYCNLPVPGTEFKVKDFQIDMLLNKDLPLRDWGIYWLKASSRNGNKNADKLLAVWAEYDK